MIRRVFRRKSRDFIVNSESNTNTIDVDDDSFENLSKIIQDNQLTQQKFLYLAGNNNDNNNNRRNKYNKIKLTKELNESKTGGMSYFNCQYQMKLSLIGLLHKKLKEYKGIKLGKNDNEIDSILNVDRNNKQKCISNTLVQNLCDNFYILNDLIRKDNIVSANVLQILLESIGELDLNSLENEPTV